MLSHTSTRWAPWYVIPADRKWFARIGAGAVLVNTLMEIDPWFPRVSKQRREELLEIKHGLEAQAPEGAAPDPFEPELKAAKDDQDGSSAKAAGAAVVPATSE
jgi:hypothetical protein